MLYLSDASEMALFKRVKHGKSCVWETFQLMAIKHNQRGYWVRIGAPSIKWRSRRSNCLNRVKCWPALPSLSFFYEDNMATFSFFAAKWHPVDRRKLPQVCGRFRLFPPIGPHLIHLIHGMYCNGTVGLIYFGETAAPDTSVRAFSLDLNLSKSAQLADNLRTFYSNRVITIEATRQMATNLHCR